MTITIAIIIKVISHRPSCLCLFWLGPGPASEASRHDAHRWQNNATVGEGEGKFQERRTGIHSPQLVTRHRRGQGTRAGTVPFCALPVSRGRRLQFHSSTNLATETVMLDTRGIPPKQRRAAIFRVVLELPNVSGFV